MVIRILPNADALAAAAADEIAQRLSPASGGRDVGLAGGSTPQAAYRRLAERPLPWSEVHAWMTDERHVPIDHPESNAGMARRALFDHVPATLHTVPWHEAAMEAAAAFERHLASILPLGPAGIEPWLVVLGVGEDGGEDLRLVGARHDEHGVPRSGEETGGGGEPPASPRNVGRHEIAIDRVERGGTR